MSTYVDCQYMNHLNNYVGVASEMSTKVDLHVESVRKMSTGVDAMSFSGNSFQIKIAKKCLLIQIRQGCSRDFHIYIAERTSASVDFVEIISEEKCLLG